MLNSANVTVVAPARLHFGVLDLRGSLGRRFGGLGAAITNPSLHLEATAAYTITADGPDAERTLEYAKRVQQYYRLSGGAHFHVHHAIPAHAGLGSGTQLGLAVARALAELYGLPLAPAELAAAVDRGRRSAVGTWAFALGGFILEGGRRANINGVAPLLARLSMPPHWRYVLAIPPGPPGLSGEAEAAAFARLPPPPETEVERVAHLVLMQLLPALADADLPAFGAALSEVQRITGGWFAPAQGGAFASELGQQVVEQMALGGAAGVGQSSWGPAVYGIVDRDEDAVRLYADVRAMLPPDTTIYQGAFAADGAQVTQQKWSNRTD